jgi:dihydroxy-acid dehydratase
MPNSDQRLAVLRSQRWFDSDGMRAFGHRSRMMQMGFAPDEYRGKPVIAIINTWSGLAHCHAHFPERAKDVARGVAMNGGFPVEAPVMALPETLSKPTSMLYRNLLAMEVEETLRSLPVDGAVLMGGCDKTTPALLMGAISANLPAIFVPAGPMLRGNWRGRVLGSGSDIWKYWDEKRAGKISESDWTEMEAGINRSAGVCMTMGTAATMTAIAEVLGMCLPGASSIPAVDSSHSRMAASSGRRVVDMVWEALRPTDILTSGSFDNAIVANAAIAGSTNAIIHLIAIARRAGVGLTLDRFEQVGNNIPVIANLRPSGAYLMEDFYYAGGLPALLAQLGDALDLSQKNVLGQTLKDTLADAKVWNGDVIRPLSNPISTAQGLAVLRGNLAPSGCVMKPSAADPRLLRHKGPAVVFSNYADLVAGIDAEDLDVTPDSVIVLQNAGPQGGPGMPEWGMLPIPKKLVLRGVRDMVRISDARMSGTSYGACILHVAPESHVGGPLSLVRSGDMIEVDVPNRTLNLLVPESELAARRAAWRQPAGHFARGYGAIYTQHVGQADTGCDFDFLQSTTPTPEPYVL